MTSDEVILRRQRSTDGNGSETIEPPPPPRLRGQSTYLALLSSLATDLDIMLNDLRSSPSSRLLPPVSQSLNSSSPAPVGGSGVGGSSSTSGGAGGHSSGLHRSNQSVQIIPSQSVSTTARGASPTPEHRYHHYYYHQQQQQQQQQYSNHQSYRLNQEYFSYRQPNSSNLRTIGVRSGVQAHHQASEIATATTTITSSPNSRGGAGAFQSIATGITTAAATTTSSSQPHHQTSASAAAAAEAASSSATTTATTLLGSNPRTATSSAAHSNERDFFW